MAGFVPHDFIDNLLARVDIVEIISPRINLAKAGSDFKALCPFHNEKTPSFFVSSNKQFYHCFGCGAHGNAIGFIMQYDHLDFIEAVETLATHLGLELPRVQVDADTNAKNENQKSYDLLLKVSEIFQSELTKSLRAKKYLETRQVNQEVCQRFALGFAPIKDGGLMSLLQANEADLKEQLLVNGLLVKNDEQRTYDRFRDRIMFPIHDRRGRVIAFGGRSIGDDLPKYLNSPETPLFHKGDELYGLFEARRDNRKLEKIVIVEGYMDVIALAQYGINYAVASMGTSITAKQIQLLLREATELIFCFDGDQAGQTAAWRALEIILPLMRDGICARFFILPEKEDPDSYVRIIGKDKFLKDLSVAQSLPDFLFDHLKEGIDMKALDGRAALAKQAKKLINKMPNGVFKELLMHQLAQLVGIDLEKLKETDFGAKESTRQSRGNLIMSDKKPLAMVKKALALLLYQPALAKEITNWNEFDSLDSPHVHLLTWLGQFLQKQSNFAKITVGTILAHCDNAEEAGFLSGLAAELPLIPDQGLKNELLGTISNLVKYVDEEKLDLLLQKAKNVSLTSDEKHLLQQLIAKTKYFN